MNPSDPSVINCPTDAPKWHEWKNQGVGIRKIVLGPSPGDNDGKPLPLQNLPENFATLFPNLTHLYLWRIEGLRSLPTLPPNLECLDTRGCQNLEIVTGFPESLETIVMDGCVSVKKVLTPLGSQFPQLSCLSLQKCWSLAESWIHQMIKSAPKLRHVDLTDCTQLVRLLAWPSSLDRIDLNGCKGLKAVPKQWPPELRRLGLRGASTLSQLPRLPESVDFLDLASTENLRRLPELPGGLRTLFLYNSGILMPPASEHGKDSRENVALRTQDFFKDVELVGKGEVKRCKLLFLGNGSAGKTCLALRLVPGKDPKRDNPGSTHGVQFWDWDYEADVGGEMEAVHLHLWDFGGQEIYHSTHRLFMSKGAVFLVLWHPSQDGKDPPKCDTTDYQDEWRPLQYWLDLIHLSCPHNPRIAIVCSHQKDYDEGLDKLWKSQVTENHQQYPCFQIDALEGFGQLDDLKEWLRDEVGEVVHTQGVAVPSYWEIAQDLAAGWIPKPGEHRPAVNELHPDQFREELKTAIDHALKQENQQGLEKLKEATENGTFTLTENRIHRTLDFLTHSGWVYWDRQLFEGRVIVGQQWALEGIYTVLDRRRRSDIYRALRNADGQFTRKNLNDWVWESRYLEGEQRLLISFMNSVGVCFELVPESESWWREGVYKTFEHLPTAKELNLQRQFDIHLDPQSAEVTCDLLHKGHWHLLLKDLGQRYGTDAEYALDGFYLKNKEGQAILLLAEFNNRHLGGRIVVNVAGPDSGARVESLVTLIKGVLPDSEGNESSEQAPEKNDAGAGTRVRKIEIFFSYTWDPEDQRIPTNYEVPVNALHNALKDEQVLQVHFDKHSMRGGDSIVQFMQRIKEADKVLIIHSDKYWKSPFCMYEFSELMKSFPVRRTNIADVLILVEHATSGIADSARLEQYREEWKLRNSMPTMMKSVTNLDDLKIAVEYAFVHFLPNIEAMKDRKRPWPENSKTGQTDAAVKQQELIEWVRQLIGLKPPTPKP